MGTDIVTLRDLALDLRELIKPFDGMPIQKLEKSDRRMLLAGLDEAEMSCEQITVDNRAVVKISLEMLDSHIAYMNKCVKRLRSIQLLPECRDYQEKLEALIVAEARLKRKAGALAPVDLANLGAEKKRLQH